MPNGYRTTRLPDYPTTELKPMITTTDRTMLRELARRRKDTHTCEHHSERFDRWLAIAREVRTEFV